MLDPFPGASGTSCRSCGGSHLHGALFRHFDLSCVAPQSFEGVVFANILLKNVDDDVTKVDDNPLGRRCSFDAERRMALGLELVDHMVCDRARLSLRFSGADDQVIGNGGQFGDMQDENVGGLFVQDGTCHRQRFGF